MAEEDYKTMITRFVEDINSVELCLIIVTGEANCCIFNSPLVKKALFNAQVRGVGLRIMAGPVVSVDNTKTNTILELIGKKNVYVYKRKARALMHYRIMDGKRIYGETPHEVCASPSKRKILNVSEDKQAFWAKNLAEEFEYEIKMGIAEKVYDKEEFLCWERGKIKFVAKKVDERGKSFDFLTKDQLVLIQ